MPAVKWLKSTVPPRDYLRDMFSHYTKNQKITSAELGQRLSMTPEGVRHKRQKSTDTWTIADIHAWTWALGIPPEEVAEAVIRTLSQPPKARKAN